MSNYKFYDPSIGSWVTQDKLTGNYYVHNTLGEKVTVHDLRKNQTINGVPVAATTDYVKVLTEEATVQPLDLKNPLNRQAGGSHYKDFAIQPIEYCQKNNIGWIEGNVVKYVSRHRKKDKARDIKKAIHMLEVLLKIEYNETYSFEERIQ